MENGTRDWMSKMFSYPVPPLFLLINAFTGTGCWGQGGWREVFFFFSFPQ